MTHDRPSRDHRDLRERIAVKLFRMVNPLTSRMIPAGTPTGAPNVLLLIPGRRSGIERTTRSRCSTSRGTPMSRRPTEPRAGAGACGRPTKVTMILSGGHCSQVHPAEIPPDEAAAILGRALAPCHRSRLLRQLLGPRVRPPVGLLRRYRVRIDGTPQEYLAEAQRHPLFELQPKSP